MPQTDQPVEPIDRAERPGGHGRVDEPSRAARAAAAAVGAPRFADEPQDEFLSAAEAARLLGVKLPTVYAYTSRGLIQSVPGGRGRARRYRRRDLERLCARRDARAGHGPVAAAALRQGEPVMDSAITLISLERGPVYRGRAALDLAREGRSFEWVAEGLWSGDWREERPEPANWHPDGPGLDSEAFLQAIPERIGPLSVLSVAISLLAAGDPGRFSWHPDIVHARARGILRRMVALLGFGVEREGADGSADPLVAMRASLAAPNLARAIGAAFSRDLTEDEERALNRALVLAADHELNASTFAARVVASTGADVYGCLSAALAALSGPRHGGAADRVDALLREAGPADRVEQVVHDRQRRGEVIEGFAHPIYAPHPDPRGTLLIEIARELRGESPEVRSALALVDAMQEGGFGGPSIDVGLVAIARALAFPIGSATALFAIGRTAGWVAHALEQYQAGYLLRPRARYREDLETPRRPAHG
ncbi:MAG TPA: helix-turn-helix domain-containing protein [Deltaproteobacteria bacterium]|nr:helix-turn-helix domain-containing protein [Deltaproteobacteria bacterium]